MIDESGEPMGLHITSTADPFFTVSFGDTVHWIYPEAAPLAEPEQRTIYTCLHRVGVGQRQIPARGVRDAAGVVPDELTETIRGYQPSRILLTAVERRLIRR